MNEVMKVLAVVMMLFVPPTLIAGIDGMTFSNLPELHTHDGYFITPGIMFFIFPGIILFSGKEVGFSIFMSLNIKYYLTSNHEKLVKDYYHHHHCYRGDAVFPASEKFYYSRRT